MADRDTLGTPFFRTEIPGKSLAVAVQNWVEPRGAEGRALGGKAVDVDGLARHSLGLSEEVETYCPPSWPNA